MASVLDYADVLVDIRGQGREETPGRLTFECVVQVQGSGERRATIELDENALDISKPHEYGVTLGRALSTPALSAAIAEARAMARSGVRVRLQIDERADRLQPLRWELVRLEDRQGAMAAVDAAASATTPFSRYVPLAEQDRTPPNEPVFTVLVALANPTGLDQGLEIPVEREIESLLEEFIEERLTEISRLHVRLMPGRTVIPDALKQKVKTAGWTLVDGSTSLRQIQTELQRGCHALHLICHGRTLRTSSELTLEDDGGGRIQIADAKLSAWYHPRLQLVLLQSCRTAVLTPDRPTLSHIAGQMLRLGVPAVVGMQDLVAMNDARYFAAAFYRSLLRDGLVDVAANSGRLAMQTQPMGLANWSIPALYMRLKGGLLWSPDAVRDYVVAKQRDLQDSVERGALPLKVIEHTKGLELKPGDVAGPWFGMSARTSELMHKPDITVVLTGPPGCGKTGEAIRLFLELADAYLVSTAARPVAPVFAKLSDFSPWKMQASDGRPGLFDHFRQIAGRRPVPEELSSARFAFVVERDTGLARGARFDALNGLRNVLDAFPGSACLLTWGETDLSDIGTLARTTAVLAVQPMNALEIRGYLRRHDAGLLVKLLDNRLDDLATSPWLLGQMREQARIQRGESALGNRAKVLEACVSRMLTKFDTSRMPLAVAERVLEAIAWRIQEKRPTEKTVVGAERLGQAEVDRVITAVRGSGEFSIAEIRRGLIECDLIAQNGDGDVRFTSRSIRAFLAARYLAKSPDVDELVDNLAAAFGRLGRLRYWTETLVIAAGLPEFKAHRLALLNSILTGSSMLEGEQVYLAARLYVEMAAAAKGGGDTLFDPDAARTRGTDSYRFAETVRQIVDSLVWRAGNVEGRPYDDRRKAVDHLSKMRHTDAVPHLIRIAVDRVRKSGSLDDANVHFEYAGLRFLAMDGLWQQVDETLAEVKKRSDAEGLNKVIAAWSEMHQDATRTEPLLNILGGDNAEHAPIAAFALLQFGPDVIEKLLLPLYWNTLRNWELLWCITEGLALLADDWLAAKVIDPAIEKHRAATDGPVRNDLRAMLCYLIRELGDVPADSPRRRYVEQALTEGDQKSRIWALRALAALKDQPTGVAGTPGLTPKRLAEAVVTEDRATLDPLAIEPDWRWKQGALEALRDVGDSDSFEIIRTARSTLRDPLLLRLSFQVAEEIYWRSIGGMIQATT